jgi:tRNA modification GTPase
VLDELGRAAAEEALGRAGLVLFCVDVTSDDFAILQAKRLLTPLIPVGTKCDLLDAEKLREKEAELAEVFSMRAIMTSSHTGLGIDELAGAIEKVVASQMAGSAEAGERIAINERHRNVVKKALAEADMARKEAGAGNGEVAAMLLRSGYEVLSQVEREDVNEAVLDRIFSNFCVGK